MQEAVAVDKRLTFLKVNNQVELAVAVLVELILMELEVMALQTQVAVLVVVQMHQAVMMEAAEQEVLAS
tara:strand:- start:58 stop:264 length:207 start_codon:yes stop_codon:yes gene_type:complete